MIKGDKYDATCLDIHRIDILLNVYFIIVFLMMDIMHWLWYKQIPFLTSMDRVEQMKQIQHEALELFIKKNADYGDAFATFGTIGVLVRIEDKIKRCISISSKKVQLVDDETLRDTLIDLHNYAAMALMLE